jgi:AcrR family transcriptional regulator
MTAEDGMGRKGWGGSPPADDAEARKRIVDAAVRSVELRGPADTSVADVAADLGITRKTVYRYFAGTEELFTAVSEVAVDRWVAELEAATAWIEDARELLVETVAHIVETLPRDPLLSLLLATGHTAVFSEQMLTGRSVTLARTILLSRQVVWPALGLEDEALDELVEHLIRVTQSLIVVPPSTPRTAAELRAYLRRWAVPPLPPSPGAPASTGDPANAS